MRLFFAALTAMIVSAPAAAQDWWVAETNNFIIKSQDSEENTRQFAVELERFDMALRTLQNMTIGEEQPTPATKLTVYRFGDTGDIGRMAGQSGVAGFYIPRAGDSVAYTPARAERRRSMSVTDTSRNRARAARLDEVSVLQHEYVHYFMMQNFPAAYPAWYVEGYAELLATVRFNDDGSFHVGDPPQYRAAQIFRMSQFQLEDMLDQEHDLAGREAYQFYGTGWLLAHYLNFNPERLAQLNEYLIAIGQGEHSLEAARRIFGDLRAIDRELLSYRDGPFPGLDVNPADYVEPVAEMRPMTAIEQALISDEMRLRRGVGKDESKDLASRIRRDMASFPDDPHALTLLASAEYGAENFEAAEATARRLLEVDPNSVEANLILSYVAIERIEDDPSWMAAAQDFAGKALAADMDDPRPRIAYYYSFVEADQDPPESAIIALEQAFDTAGSDAGYRILLSRQLLVENRLDSARSVLLPISFRGFNPDSGQDEEDEDEPSLNKIMDFIAEGNRDAALTMMDELIDDEDDEDED
ncbi:hypothetical protein [Alteraurantiacibacter aestuarii]|uniref:tetratricopeptide repeat protein n=1 Tax=Alteraurantiacibacter aestuarii TaxID=650004 RepID=UPI0031CE352B